MTTIGTLWTGRTYEPDGVPPAGKITGFQTFASCIYAYTLRRLSNIVGLLHRPGLCSEYGMRSKAIAQSVRRHCFDGAFFTDGLADNAHPGADYSQHSQIWAVLCGAIEGEEAVRLLRDSLLRSFSPTSTAMTFYKLRALSAVGGDLYDSLFFSIWKPWQAQLSNNVTTWVEDDVNQRSDCHAWGCVPLYEFIAEVCGITPREPGWGSLNFKPRLSLFPQLDSKVPIRRGAVDGESDIVHVQWKYLRPGMMTVTLSVETNRGHIRLPIHVKLPNGYETIVFDSYHAEVEVSPFHASRRG